MCDIESNSTVTNIFVDEVASGLSINGSCLIIITLIPQIVFTVRRKKTDDL